MGNPKFFSMSANQLIAHIAVLAASLATIPSNLNECHEAQAELYNRMCCR